MQMELNIRNEMRLHKSSLSNQELLQIKLQLIRIYISLGKLHNCKWHCGRKA